MKHIQENSTGVNNTGMQIRRADAADASFLARGILIAGRAHCRKGIWEVILGGGEDEVLRFLHHISITKISHLFHYSCYLIAEEDGHGPVGLLGGYNPETSGYEALQRAIPEVMDRLNLPGQSFAHFEERASKILACLPKTIEGTWVIDSVATLPGHRRKGIAEKLLNRILEIGREQDHAQAQVSMYIGNQPALKLYRKFGFQVIEENRDEYFEENIGSPGMQSLFKKLIRPGI